MDGRKARLGAGDVEIDLDGETMMLKPSLKAAQTLSRQNGGISAAIQAVSKLEFDVLVQVITLGIGASDSKQVAEKVWRTGMTTLAAPAIKYLSIIANGGRPLDDENRGGEEEQDPT